MSEPCHNCQRLTAELAALTADYFRDGIRDVVREVQAHEATKRALHNLRMEIRLLTLGPAHQHHAGKVTPFQLCELLERTDSTDPKGKP